MKKIIIGAAVLLILVVIIVVSLGRKKVSGEPVYAEKAERGDVVTVVTGTGVIQPRSKVNISSQVYGEIVELPVDEGQSVEKGKLLVRIDPEKYRAEVDRLSANVRVSRTAIEEEEVSLRNLELEERRARELYAQKILSSSERERAELAVETSRIRLKSLKESVAQAEASLSRAQDDLAKTTLFAPMPGRVTQVNTEVGEQVIVGTTNVPGSVMMVISDMSEILAEVNVDETEIVALRPGQTAKVTADAVEKTTYEGKVTEIGNTARKQGEVNVFGVKILLTNPDERLRPGMTAKAKIEVDRRENVLRIPIQAVTSRERRKLEEDRKAAGELKKSTTVEKASADTLPAGEPAADKATAEKASLNNKSESAGDSQAGTSDGEAGKDSAASTSNRAESANPKDDKKKSGKASEREEIEVVYVIEKDIVQAVPVTTGASDEAYVEIKAGITEGQTIVKGPYRILRKLKEGDRIVVKDEGEELEAEQSGSGSEGGE